MRLRLVVPVLALAAIAVGLSVFWLPVPRLAEAPATEIAALRAFAHVRAMAERPHPAGSEDSRRVREYVSGVLREMGLKVERQEATEHGIPLVNVYAELRGTEPGRACALLVSHYDSADRAPGAADAASGVATLLETIRVLQAHGPLRNTLAFLITDGEERGMLGATAFVRMHPELLQPIRVVVNLEARGNHGPVLMFETGPGSLGLMRAFGRVCPHPAASSFSQDIYRRMPNDTDFTVFLRSGKHGYNFAFVGGVEHYHSPQDTPENLSLRTLQHYGDSVLAVARFLGGADERAWAELEGGADAVYFSPCRGLLVCYPATWVWPLAGVLVVTYACVLGCGLWRRRVRMGRLFGVAGVTLMVAVVVALLGALVLAGLVRIWSVRVWAVFVVGLPYALAVLLALISVAMALGVGARLWMARWAKPAEALAGGLVWWIVLGLAASAWLPGASYLFVMPALVATIALGLMTRADADRAWNRGVCVFLTVVPAPGLFAAVTGMLYQALTVGITPVCMLLSVLAVELVPFFNVQATKMTTAAVTDGGHVI